VYKIIFVLKDSSSRTTQDYSVPVGGIGDWSTRRQGVCACPDCITSFAPRNERCYSVPDYSSNFLQGTHTTITDGKSTCSQFDGENESTPERSIWFCW